MKYLRKGKIILKDKHSVGVTILAIYRQTKIICWQCGKQGHIHRNCTNTLGDPNLDYINTIHSPVTIDAAKFKGIQHLY